jgi:hypothetical protein
MSFKAIKNTKVIDYFSDDEVEEQATPGMDDYPTYDDEEGEYEYDEEEEEMDEETRRMLFEKASINIDRFTDELNELTQNAKKLKEDKLNKKLEKKQNKLNKNGKCTLSIAEFTKKLEEEEKANKPKKFVSRRADERKKELGIDEVTGPKRAFAPRKPPYNFVRTHDIKVVTFDVLNPNDFPSL